LATSPCHPATLEQLVNPTERQREFLRAIAERDFVLYGGEAGGGKSYILRWWLILFLVWAFKARGLRNVRVGMFCEDYPTLNDRQISKMYVEFPPWLGTLARSGTRDFKLRPEYGGGVIALRNLDDPSKYYSAEFAAIAVDELTRNPLSVFNDLRFRMRWPGIDRPKFGAGTNPGGPGHAWVKRYWIPGAQQFPPELEPIRDEFVLVRAKASDNPHLSANYHKSLFTLPPDMARMVARGDWEVYTGQFYPQFESTPGRHVRPAAEMFKAIKPWHTRWLGGDWGYEHPHALYWLAQDEGGKVRVYREQWGRRTGETELGRLLTAGSSGEKLSAFAFSWDAGKLSPRSQPTLPKSMMQMVTDALGDGMPKPYPADSSPGSRVSGARLLSQLLDADMLEISDACPRLIECLPTLIRDEDNLEDVLKVDFAANEIGDDPYDGLRMALQHMGQAGLVPVTVLAERRVAAYAETLGKDVEELDINTTAQLHRRALAQEQRKRNQRKGGLGRIWRPQTGN
jgi:phage terminase large subunit